MSVINNNPFGPELAAPGLQQFEFGSTAGGGYAQLPAASDSIGTAAYGPVTLPITSPVLSLGGCQSPANAGGSFQSGFGNILNQISNAISNLFSQISAAFGSAGSGSTNSGTTLGGTCAPGPAGAANGEAQFASATASSSGDPHLAFSGTTAAGAAVDENWKSMRSHGDLLDSNSFAGGYRVSTQVTQPNAQGVTYNASASVTTAAGATTVSMRADGSYAVSSGGANVALQPGQTTSLGNGESVTLNADGSLTVNDTNAAGGSIATTLKSNGDGGVDVTTQATNVDLGGYLVNRSEPSAGGAVSATAPWNAAASTPVWTAASPPGWNAAASVATDPFAQYSQLTQAPAASTLDQFDPEAAETSLQNIELA
jgi:hypothetical protein